MYGPSKFQTLVCIVAMMSLGAGLSFAVVVLPMPLNYLLGGFLFGLIVGAVAVYIDLI